MAGWAQTIIAAVIAVAGGLGWTAWVGRWVGGVDSRLVVVERFANASDDKWSREIHGVEARLAGLERECGRVQAEYPIRLHGLERRVEVSEDLLQRFADLAPLIRDSNDLQRQRMNVDGGKQ